MLTDAQITDIRNAQTRAHRHGCAAMVASCKAAEKAGKGARVVWNRERAEWMGLRDARIKEGWAA